jgi:predicted RNase H-like nuclease (RuvC/YqgF family)
MAKSNLKLATGDPPRTPERDALADAIEHYNAITLHRDRLKEAFKRTEDELYGDGSAHRGVETAEAALAEAKANEPAYLASIAPGEADEAANPIKLAELAFEAANAQLDRVDKTREALQQQIKVAADDASYADTQLEKAVRAVFRSEAAGIIDATLRKAAALQAELQETRLRLWFLKNACFEPWPPSEETRPIRDYLAAPIFPLELNDKIVDTHPSLASWHSAAVALRTDADAPLLA